MSESQNTKLYDLEERTLDYAKKVRVFVKKLPKTISNVEDARQLIRSSGSVGANYIEANESLSKKDFIMRIRISRKEAKESRYWLNLLNNDTNEITNKECSELINESSELLKILTSILKKSGVF